VIAGDAIILSDKVYHMSPLQINAICTRLALPEPTCGKTTLSSPGRSGKVDWLELVKCD